MLNIVCGMSENDLVGRKCVCSERKAFGWMLNIVCGLSGNNLVGR